MRWPGRQGFLWRRKIVSEDVVNPARITIGGVEVSPRSSDTLNVSQPAAEVSDRSAAGRGRSRIGGPGDATPSVVGRLTLSPACPLPPVLRRVVAAWVLLAPLFALALWLMLRRRNAR